MKKIEVIIFDVDGVLFDTKKANSEYYNQILRHIGKPPLDSEQFAFCQMHTADESLAYLFQDPNELETAKNYRKTLGYASFIKYMEMEPNLKPLLGWLKSKYKTAIATNRSDTMERVLTEFDLKKEFDLVVTALDVEHPKPSPEPLFKILAYFDTDSYHAIYVGDSKLDETAAKAAGIPLVAYQNPSLAADFHITSLKEIKTILEANGW